MYANNISNYLVVFQYEFTMLMNLWQLEAVERGSY